MRYFLILGLFLFLFSCGTNSSNVKNDKDKILYQGQAINIISGSAGLPDSIHRLYLTFFTDYSSTENLQQIFDQKLRLHLQELAGIRVEDKIPDAQAVVEGKIDTYAQSPASQVTNLDSLLYQLNLTYSVRDMKGIYIQKNKSVSEKLLITDTNTYTPTEVLPILVDLAARNTAESILYGWQKEYQKTPAQISALGEVITNDLSTNR